MMVEEPPFSGSGSIHASSYFSVEIS